MKLRVSISLWWVNYWLRFTGFRVFVRVQPTGDQEGDMQARIGLMWWGGPFKTGWPDTT